MKRVAVALLLAAVYALRRWMQYSDRLDREDRAQSNGNLPHHPTARTLFRT